LDDTAPFLSYDSGIHHAEVSFVKNKRAILSLSIPLVLAGLTLACPNPGGGGPGGGGPDGGTPSSDAALSALTLSVGAVPVAFTPSFSASRYSYSAGVPNGVTSVTLTATTRHAKASLTIHGKATSSGVPSDSVTLTAGADVDITAAVVAEDGATTRNYTVTVRRAASSEKQITGFAFLASDNMFTLQSDYQGVINEPGKTITISIPKDMISAPPYTLKPQIAFVGSSVSPASGAARTFTDGVPTTYTVTDANGDTQGYDVTVRIIPLATLKGTIMLPGPDAAAQGTGANISVQSSNTMRSAALTWAADNQSATYIFDGVLAAGTYTLTLLIDMDHSGAPSPGDYYGEVTAIVLPATGTFTQDMSLTKITSLASVNGTVTISGASASGKTLEIDLINQSGSIQAHALIPLGSGSTTSYTVTDVPPGTYYVQGFIDMNGDATLSQGDYQGYYDGTGIFPPAAANLTVPTSINLGGVDFTLSAVPAKTASISGTITLPAGDADGKMWAAFASLSPDLHSSPFFGMSSPVTWSGTGKSASYTISGLFPGSYYVGVFVDMNANDTIDSGDYFGFSGGAGINPPASPNATITVGQALTGVNVTAGTLP
jgi:uncharacterized protein (DUF2141 family)